MRPYLYRLAQQHQLVGWVHNAGQGVELTIQGKKHHITAFLQQLPQHTPKLARLDAIHIETHSPILTTKFEISQTQSTSALETLCIPTDQAICPTCVQELYQPNDRYNQSLMLQCADCGPRYTQMHALPYTRSQTSLAEFSICSECQKAFDQPNNRRFHVENNLCPQCEPQYTLHQPFQEPTRGHDAIQKLTERLKQGAVIACKGIGGFHLLCDATQTEAVKRLRQIKQRPSKPLAILCRDLKMASVWAHISAHEQAWLTSSVRPIVLLESKHHPKLSNLVAPNSASLGILLAYSAMHYRLFDQLDVPLVATSANRSSEPICYQLKQINNSLGQMIDGILDHQLEILHPCEDSVMQCLTEHHTQVLRLGRGLAPKYLPLSKAETCTDCVLALGGQQKNTIAVQTSTHRMLMPYTGELHDLSGLERFEQSIQTALKFYRLQPTRLVWDAHPHYTSSEWGRHYAQTHSIPYSTVQHHYAHALACMAEHQLDETLIAIVWDGQGYDPITGQIWGGEVLKVNRQDFQRLHSLTPFPLLGNEQAILEPRRIALAWLFGIWSMEQIQNANLACLKTFSTEQIQTLYQVYRAPKLTPMTSSMGRWFDGVASLLGLVQKLDFEGQSGLLLETYYSPSLTETYPIDFNRENWSTPELVQFIIDDLAKGEQTQQIVSRFFNTLVKGIDVLSERYADYGLVLSGGVLQNKTLMRLIIQRLGDRRYYFQQATPINDGGLALGQSYWQPLTSKILD